MIKLTEDEKNRITQIRFALRRLKREGYDISTWEATCGVPDCDCKKYRREK